MEHEDVIKVDIDLTQKFQKHIERLPSVTTEEEQIEIEKAQLGPYNLNFHLDDLEEDYLYHISLGKKTNNLQEMFSDVRFICMGGSPKRMHQFALYIKNVIGYKLPPGLSFENISEPSDRYSMYKVGPVLSVNHGIGCPSMSILLHELIKLVHYAKCKDVTFFRMGTSGGVGVTPGTLVITNEAVDGMFKPEYKQIVLGKEVSRKTECNQKLVQELYEIGKDYHDIQDVTVGKTMCAHDFYEGQARVDGAFCEYTTESKMKFLKSCSDNGIKNIEMESLCFTGMLNHAKLKGAVICVTLVDRLRGDQVTVPHDLNIEYQERPFKLVGEYIRRKLNEEKA